MSRKQKTVIEQFVALAKRADENERQRMLDLLQLLIDITDCDVSNPAFAARPRGSRKPKERRVANVPVAKDRRFLGIIT